MRVSTVVLSDEEAAQAATKGMSHKSAAVRDKAASEALSEREVVRAKAQAKYDREAGRRDA